MSQKKKKNRKDVDVRILKVTIMKFKINASFYLPSVRIVAYSYKPIVNNKNS